MIHNRELIELYKSGNLLQLLKTYTYNNDLQLIKELEKDFYSMERDIVKYNNGQTILYLKDTANISSGGTAEDVTDLVHPSNVFMAERIARLMNLDICGIDIMAEDVAEPITNQNGAIIEVNAGPGLRMHLSPTEGTARNVAEPLVEMLFPNNAE